MPTSSSRKLKQQQKVISARCEDSFISRFQACASFKFKNWPRETVVRQILDEWVDQTEIEMQRASKTVTKKVGPGAVDTGKSGNAFPVARLRLLNKLLAERDRALLESTENPSESSGEVKRPDPGASKQPKEGQ